MKRLDQLVLKELSGPWAFGVAMFTVLIMAGSFLFELTKYFSHGIDPGLILKLFVFLLPGVMVKTFPMAVLLAGLLSFGRLSSDSEIVAIKAAGVSVGRIMVPVFWFGLTVALVTFFVNDWLVPSATQQAVGLKKEFESQLNGKTAQEMSHAFYQDGKLKASFWAADFSYTKRTLDRVIVTVYDANALPSAYLYVDEMVYTSEKVWEIRGGGKITPASGGSMATFERAFPSGTPPLDATPEELLAKTLRDLDALPVEQMKAQIEKNKQIPVQTESVRAQTSNLEFGLWNKFSLPLAALVFGLVGAPLGIRSHRVPASAGFWIAVIIILVYFFITNVMSILAQGGRVPAYLASFLPTAIGLVVGGILIHKRNN